MDLEAQTLREVPELGGTLAGLPPIRIPHTGNIGTTPRLRRLLDTRTLQRLRGIRQLGLAHLVYPGATHSRFEHSLGTYEMARTLLVQLLHRRGRDFLSPQSVATFLCAALLHDVGHYPFSHTLEELPSDDKGRARRHDQHARDLILADEELADRLRSDWGIEPARIADIIDEDNPPQDEEGRRLTELLSGALNPDRLDYLFRDSNHVGVPYGQVIDMERLLHAVDFVPDGSRLAVTRKGVSAVETVIFASYLMYREVYWHHTVRAAQAMLRWAVMDGMAHRLFSGDELLALDDGEALQKIREGTTPEGRRMVERLLMPGRPLYRRVASATMADVEEGRVESSMRDLFRQALLGDAWERYRLGLEASLALGLPRSALIFDVAGQGKELFFEVPVLDRLGGQVVGTTAQPEISLVAPNLSRNFERQAKTAQLLAAPEMRETIRGRAFS
ncbi:MAG: HD domain-containing protein [Bacillota bacterium]|nr:HD domain-containing protein [Bacillota bacterium]